MCVCVFACVCVCVWVCVRVRVVLSLLSAGNYLRRNTVLRELWLAHNDLSHIDAFNIAIVLKANYHLQFLDVSNNKIEVRVTKQKNIFLLTRLEHSTGQSLTKSSILAFQFSITKNIVMLQ